MRKIVIIGGGLAGLITSIQLVRAGIPCVVIEKKSYPFHRVCGEYISNEVLPFLKSAGLYPDELCLPQISIFELSSVRGTSFRIQLDLGGFGVSRFSFDNFLYRKAVEEGVGFLLNTEATAIDFDGNAFKVTLESDAIDADVVIGSFGKRSRIDVQQNRNFIRRRSPYVGVKYHVYSSHPHNLIALHNFPGGYCGVSNVEDGVTNLCYLAHRDSLRDFGTIKDMERGVLFTNPGLRSLFLNSTFIFNKPEVINEISFDSKQPVENHILMAGDAAGMIAPLCGNGMAIAIRSGKILAEVVIAFCRRQVDRSRMEEIYRAKWNEAFRFRLWFGRNVQRLFGRSLTSAFAVNVGAASNGLAKFIVARTHGRPF